MISCIESGEIADDLVAAVPSIAHLRQENERLCYRCGILEEVGTVHILYTPDMNIRGMGALTPLAPPPQQDLNPMRSPCKFC